MELVEEGAVEAMLNLSRPTTSSTNPSDSRFPSTKTYLHIQPLPPPSSQSTTTTATITIQPKHSDMASGSSISPSPSPTHPLRKSQPSSIPQAPPSKPVRPHAMRLSQLLTHTVTEEPPSSVLTTQRTLSYPMPLGPLPLPPLKLTPRSTSLPLTEPVTPPFSPPVLPPLASVTGLQHFQGVAALGAGGSALRGSWNGNDSAVPKRSTEWRPLHGGSNSTLDVPADPSASTSRYDMGSTKSSIAPGTLRVASTDMTQNSIGGVTEGNGGSDLRYGDIKLARVEDKVGSIGLGTESTAASGEQAVGMHRRGIKRAYKKYYSNPTPSSHCHVCARTSKAVKFAVCARIAEGLCRKVTCYKCFVRFGWDWEEAMRGRDWVCVHCRGVCPEGRSQCYIYSRVNSKRESKRGSKKQTAEGEG